MTRATPWSSKQIKDILNLDNQQNRLAEKYGVSAATIANLRKKHGLAASSRTITKEQRELILSSYGCASYQQIAKFVGMSKTQVYREICKYKKSGKIESIRRGSIFYAPQMLLAKTCISCGNIMQANWFYMLIKDDRKYWNSKCKRCENDSAIANRKDAGIKNFEYLTLMRQITLPMAMNNGKPLSDEDHDVLKDKSKSNLQKALELGRTYDSVSGAISRFGYSGLNTRNKLPDPTSEQWIIKFPNAMKELQEYYRRLGPVDESKWDWNEVA